MKIILVYCQAIFLRLHQFLSIYLNICMNFIMLTGKTPRILTIQHITGEDNPLNAEK